MLRSFAKWFLCAALLSMPLTGCERNEVPPPRIDLAQVNDAFRETTGATFQQWMENFELKVNEIYLKDDFVMIDAQRPQLGKLRIYGYVDRNKQPGFQRGQDELLFRIVQDQGPGQFYYRLESGTGYVYARQSYGSGTGPATGFLAAYGAYMIAGAIFRPYYTPATRVVVIRNYRTTYRRSPAFSARQRRHAAYAQKTRAARASARRSSRAGGGKR
jgi:hypothetical protein